VQFITTINSQHNDTQTLITSRTSHKRTGRP